VTSPSIKRIFLVRDTTMTEDMHKIYSCQQCADHPCYDACPLQGSAMCLDGQTGVVYVDADNCIGCRLCWEAFPFEPKRIAFNLDNPPKALKCDLCRTRLEGPGLRGVLPGALHRPERSACAGKGGQVMDQLYGYVGKIAASTSRTAR
jgi:Fe-S-cluster-containing dehydrogenase component